MTKKSKLRYENTAYLYILPYYIFFMIFIALPIIVNIVLSFTDFNLREMSFVGLENYIKLFSDATFIRSVQNTIVYVVFTVGITIVLGLMCALALNNVAFWGAKFFRGIYFMPYVISMVSCSMVWLWLYEPSAGFINELMRLLGLPTQKWLYDERFAMGSVILMVVWKNLGYYMTIFIAGLNGIPSSLYEAATVDGANALQKFWFITLPMLKPVTFFITITGTVGAFNVFEQVNVMTSGGPMNSTTTIVHQIYTRAFTEFRLGYAASQAIVLLIVVLIFTLINFRYGNQGNDLDM